MGPTNVCCRRCLPLRRPPPPLPPLFIAPWALPLLPLPFLGANRPWPGDFVLAAFLGGWGLPAPASRLGDPWLGCSNIPYVCGAGDDALALHSAQQAEPDSAAPVVGFAQLSCMHIPVRWLSCSLLKCDLPGLGKAETGCNSCFHLVDGQRPRPTRSKGTYPKDTVQGWNLWFDLSNKLLVWSLPLLIGPATNIAIWASRCDAAEKPY